MIVVGGVRRGGAGCGVVVGGCRAVGKWVAEKMHLMLGFHFFKQKYV